MVMLCLFSLYKLIAADWQKQLFYQSLGNRKKKLSTWYLQQSIPYKQMILQCVRTLSVRFTFLLPTAAIL